MELLVIFPSRFSKSFLARVYLTLCIYTVFLFPPLSAYPDLLLQQGDAAINCEQGYSLYAQGKLDDALPLLEAGIKNRGSGPFDKPEIIGNCALALGQILSQGGEWSRAIEMYQVGLDVFQQSDNLQENVKLQRIGIALRLIGLAYRELGLYTKALDYYGQAQDASHKAGDILGEGIVLNNIGVVYYLQGAYTNALDSYQQALELRRSPDGSNRVGEGTTLNNIGEVYRAQGNYSKALNYFEQARTIFMSSKGRDRRQEGNTTNNIGLVYYYQGRYDRAQEYLFNALKIRRSPDGGDITGEVDTLNNIGLSYYAQKNYAEALRYFQEALTLAGQIEGLAQEGTPLNNIGQVYLDQGNYEEAIKSYEDALANAQILGDRAGEGITWNNLGLVHEAQKDYAKAQEAYEQALELHKEVGNRGDEGITLSNIGVLYEAQGQYTKALETYEQAMKVIEEVRTAAGSEVARASFIEKHADLYNRTIELYYRQGQPEQAFLTSERGRARAFLDTLATGHVELKDNEFAELYIQELEAYAVQQAAMQALAKAKEQDSPDKKMIADLEVQFANAEKDHQAKLDAITARGGQVEQLPSARNAILDTKQIQTLLDNETTVISFWVLEEKTLVFIINRHDFYAVELNIIQADLLNLIETFRDFSNIEDAHPDSLIRLYHSLFLPIVPYINSERLIIIPHGTLHYLPFAALTDGHKYVVEDYVVTYLPSASTLPYIQQNMDEGDGVPLILGNPTTGDYDATASLSTERDQLGPLPFAEAEAKNIAGQLGIQPLLASNATETLVKEQAAHTKILHLAAHGFFNASAPLSSFIALAPDAENDGWLTVSEVYGLDLENADLVVLSACETQLGDLTAGDEFVGLTRAFFFAGAPTVVASLWKVDDKTTSLLMERFYTYIQEGKGKADALRLAQMDLREQYLNPYFWAAFVLSGNDSKVGGIQSNVIQTQAATQTPMPTLTPDPGHLPTCGNGLFLAAIVFSLIRRSRKNRRS